jgi:hypothetical protein
MVHYDEQQISQFRIGDIVKVSGHLGDFCSLGHITGLAVNALGELVFKVAIIPGGDSLQDQQNEFIHPYNLEKISQ